MEIFFMKIRSAIAKDISKMYTTQELCRHTPAPPTRLEIRVGIFYQLQVSFDIVTLFCENI